jgi:hypothetical protein
MGLLDQLMYALQRSKSGQMQEKPGLRDMQLEAQLQQAQGLLAQPGMLMQPQQAMQAQQMPPQGLLSGAPIVEIDQATFSGKKKLKAKQ